MMVESRELRFAVRDLAADAASDVELARGLELVRDVDGARIAWDRAAASLRALVAYCEQHRDSVADRLCVCQRQVDCPVHGLQL